LADLPPSTAVSRRGIQLLLSSKQQVLRPLRGHQDDSIGCAAIRMTALAARPIRM